MKKTLIILLALLWLPALQAASNASAPQSKPTNDRAAFELALQACHSSASKDSTGRPDMDACMIEKGFKRPDGPPPPHPEDQQGNKGGDHAAFDAAAKACASSAKKDSNGRPDPAAMESCLSSKGFKRPDESRPEPPHLAGHPGEPHQKAMNPAFDAAIKTCAGSAKKDSNGQPDPAAMESCMSGKGFKRPDGPPPHSEGRCEQAPPPPPQQ